MNVTEDVESTLKTSDKDKTHDNLINTVNRAFRALFRKQQELSPVGEIEKGVQGPAQAIFFSPLGLPQITRNMSKSSGHLGWASGLSLVKLLHVVL